MKYRQTFGMIETGPERDLARTLWWRWLLKDFRLCIVADWGEGLGLLHASTAPILQLRNVDGAGARTWWGSLEMWLQLAASAPSTPAARINQKYPLVTVTAVQALKITCMGKFLINVSKFLEEAMLFPKNRNIPFGSTSNNSTPAPQFIN